MKQTTNPQWHVWHKILDRIINHPDYRYDTPRRQNKHLLLNLSKMAMSNLAIFNTHEVDE